MRRKPVRAMVLVLLAGLLASLPGVVGCGEKQASKPEVVVGFLGDLTGPGGLGVSQVYVGLGDYLRMADEEDLLPMKVKFSPYDTRTEYARVPIGYMMLLTQNPAAMFILSASDRELLLSKLESDEVATFGTTGSLALQGQPWGGYAIMCPAESEGATLVKWLVESWDYQGTGRKPKLGYAGMAGVPSVRYLLNGVQDFIGANPGKVDWVSDQALPTSAASFALETMRFMDCDAVMVNTFGPQLGLFTKEMRARGYTGKLIAGANAYPGYMDLVTTSVPEDSLFEIYCMTPWPMWSTSCSFIDEVKAAVAKYEPAKAEAYMRVTGYIMGWSAGTLLADVLARAAEAAGGPDKINGVLMRDAFQSTNLIIDGWGNSWTASATNNSYSWNQKIYKWDREKREWASVSDWVTAMQKP